MRSIAYWDTDSTRIRGVLRELESEFEVRLSATLEEMVGECRRAADLRAAVIGLSSVDGGTAREILGMLTGRLDCPIVLLAGGRDPLGPSETDCGNVVVHAGGPAGLRAELAALAAAEPDGEVRPPPLFIGRSRAIRRVDYQVRKYAESRHPVLILGETGSGKELAARALHTCSARRNSPFIALNCSALPDSLAENELFGSEKGAYTDAVRHKGALAKAAKGTLFLDEIGAMSLAMQPKLLRALETGEYWKLGAENPERSDFRLVSATCENIEERVKLGLFRSDLLYRISDLPIRIPPLRERMEDIPDLAEHFCREAGRGYCELSREALAKLMAYSWPGNVRELRSVLNRACANVQKGAVRAEDVTFMFCGKKDARRARRP